MSRHRLLFAFHLSLLLLAAELASASMKNVYIVYMGEKKHDDPAQVEKSHHRLLATFLGSKAAAAESILYSYKHGFSGFAAHLTEPQARTIERHSDVIHVVPNHMLKLHTTRSWDYLGLPFSSAKSTMAANTLLTQSHHMGQDVIIGVIDTGVWPESRSFADDGIGSIPTRWKGRCVDGEHFNSTLVCNKKLIGARWYVKAFLAEATGSTNGVADDDDDNPFTNEYVSARDSNGHGTHTASTAGGSPAARASSDGLAMGVARGGAPAARLAIYKACWGPGSCASADVLKAFDDAIGDGVDVLSVSLGKSLPLFYELELQNGLTIGAFHAVARGTTVVFATGNEGPQAGTVSNTAPWTINVAAITMDRAFPTRITLGNNQTILGQGMLIGKDTNFANLKYYPSTMVQASGGKCSSLPKNESSMAGSLVLCFGVSKAGMTTVRESGALGVIIAVDRSLGNVEPCADAACIFVDYEVGTQIINYFYSSSSPTAKVSPSRTYVGKPLATKVASFSNRGPNTIAPEILKPDIAAPGVNILAAYPPPVVLKNTTKVIPAAIYAFETGTSMACPHVAGIVALVRSVHPSWSPAAIRSALVTTASTTDQWGEPIISDSLQKVADPFDYGGGIVNPNKAVDPGLVYDMGMPEYIQYLCAMGYKYPALKRLTSKPVVCPTKRPSKLDVNVPAISIPNLHGLITVSRVVTNVGPVNSAYHASVVAPQGVKVSVMPNILVFNSSVKVQSFSVSFFSNHTVQGWYYFGSLTWSDGRHEVRSPIAVKPTLFLQPYADFS